MLRSVEYVRPWVPGEQLSLSELMDRALKDSGLTQNAAARAAGITGTRWRQIVDAREMKQGVPVLINGPADTLARMAHVIGVTPDELRRAKREDAAAELEQLLSLDPVDPDPDSLPQLAGALQRAQGRARHAEQEYRTARNEFSKSQTRLFVAFDRLTAENAEANRLASMIVDHLAAQADKGNEAEAIAASDVAEPPGMPAPEVP